MNINIFSEKELSIIELFAPGKTAQEIVGIVLRDWFANNRDRLYKQVKPVAEVNDEIIAISTAQKAELDKAVVK